MKKKLACFFISLALVLSCFTFVGCEETKEVYNIFTNVWHTNYGYTSGSGNYEEGKTVILHATPKNNAEFIAWVKNGQTVSFDSEYSIVISSQTAGKYTAIFTSPNLELVIPESFGATATTPDDATNPTEALTLSLSIGSSYDKCINIFNAELNTTATNEIDMDFPIVLDLRNKQYLKATLSYSYENENAEIVTKSKDTLTSFNINETELTNSEIKINMPEGFSGYINLNLRLIKLTKQETDSIEE